MKSLLATTLTVFFLLNSGSEAAIRKCFVDEKACPEGDHIHCVQHGWCGPYCENSCSSGSKPNVTEDEQPFSSDQPAPSPTPKEECSDCYSQPRPDRFCVKVCKCPSTSAFCGAW